MSSTQQTTDSTDNKQPTPTVQNSGMTRRGLLRRSAVGGATLAGVSTGAIRLDAGPVQESEAIAPAVAAAGLATTAGVSLGWSLRDSDLFGTETPPEEAAAETWENGAYNILQTRKSDNQSTFIDNVNIIEGSANSAYADAKIAAVDELNAQESESTVVNAAQNEVTVRHTKVLENILKSWNENVQQLLALRESASETDEASAPFGVGDKTDSDLNKYGDEWGETREVELPDGSEFEIERLGIQGHDNHFDRSFEEFYDALSGNGDFETHVEVDHDGNYFEFLKYDDWNDVISELESEMDTVHDEIAIWVDNIYGEVQSGELDVDELLTPREMAELTAEDEDFPQAIADLQALNVGVDLEREAEIYIPDIEATLYGQLAYTGDKTLETGTVLPDDTDEDGDEIYPGSIYFTYDISQGQGTWSAYDEGVDGGTLTLTSEPFPDTLYVVDTAAGETAEFTTSELTEDEDSEEWTIDLSDQLENAITEVEDIEYYAETDETQYETIQLGDGFEIVRFTDSDGNEYDETNFERSEPQTDDNYITEEEWQEQQERHEELIQQYEDAQGGGVTIPGFEDVLDGEANGLIGIAVVGLVFVFGILSALNPLS